MTRRRSLAQRLVSGAVVWCTLLLAGGGLLLSSMFRDAVERSFDARLDVLLESLIAASEVGDDGQVVLSRKLPDPRFERPYSGWYWQITGPGSESLRSRSLWDQELPLADEASVARKIRFNARGPEDEGLRISTQTVRLPGLAAGLRFGVAGDAAEIAAEIRRFNTTLFGSLGTLGIGLLAAVLLQVRYGLHPLRRLRLALVEIASGRANRLEGSYPSEIEPLANELNALIEQSEAIVERARTHVGNLAHALKTPLSVLTNEAVREGGPDGETVRRQTERMRRHVDHYLVRARTAGTVGLAASRISVRGVVDDLGRTLLRIHAARALRIDIDGPEQVLFRGERQDLEEMAGNLMDNACKWARGRVVVRISGRGRHLSIVVEDDGAGLPPARRDEVLKRGNRLDESVPGSGLGLSIVREIAELYGGGVALSDASLGGLRATLELPAATREGR